jgi:Flp pilus assembly pilin Flp
MKKSRGATTTEYGLIFALVLIVSLAALGGLGGSISQLLSGAGQGAFGSSGSASGLMGIIAPGPGTGVTGNTGIGGSGKTPGGLPTINSTNPSVSGINTTSVEGKNANTLGSTQMAEALEKMADKTKDPAAKAYLNEMSDTIYLMGALQGELDGVKEFEVPEVNNDQALEELLDMNKKIQIMMASPPASLSDKYETKALAFAKDATIINQKYFDALSQYIEPNGNVKSDFFFGNTESKPGLLVEQPVNAAPVARKNPKTTYDAAMSVETVKAKAAVVLAENNVGSLNVEATLKDAVGVEGVSTQLP